MRVIDCFMPLVAYVVDFRNALPQCAEYPRVREEVGNLLLQADAVGKEGRLDPDQFDEARFIICAWTDETLLASGWPDKNLWQHEQLQRRFYHTTDAGVEAFERLDALGDRQEAREVYCLCLALGFRGRYLGEEGNLLLEKLRSENLKLLWKVPDGIPPLERMELFPGSMAPSSERPADRKEPRSLLAPVPAMLLAAPVILFAVLYLVYRYVLSGLIIPTL